MCASMTTFKTRQMTEMGFQARRNGSVFDVGGLAPSSGGLKITFPCFSPAVSKHNNPRACRRFSHWLFVQMDVSGEKLRGEEP